MASSVVSEGVVLVAVVIAASALSQVFLSSMTGIEHRTITMTEGLKDKMETDIKILNAVNSSTTTVNVWIKNTGTSIIPASVIEGFDVLFGVYGGFDYVSYDEVGVGWRFSILNSVDTNWQTSETIQITITTASVLTKGDYYFSIITHNGISDETFFSIGD